MCDTIDDFEVTHEVLLEKITDRYGAESAYRNLSLRISTDHNGKECGFVTIKGTSHRLPPREFTILWMLVRAQGNLISSDDFYYFLYEEEDGDIPITNTIEVFIQRLRGKLHEFRADAQIMNRRGMGYYIE